MMGWQMSDVTTNIWNMQVFNEENANLFVILFIKALLFAQTCERNSVAVN
jgi:hypothetical protein